MSPFRRLLGVVILVSLPLLAGCGRIYRIVGVVVSVPELQLGSSLITEVTGQVTPKVGAPIVKATVRLVHQLDERGRPMFGTVWQKTVPTDGTGHFELSDYATPGDMNRVGLEVSAPGFVTAYRTYWDARDEDEHFLVILTPSKGSVIE